MWDPFRREPTRDCIVRGKHGHIVYLRKPSVSARDGVSAMDGSVGAGCGSLRVGRPNQQGMSVSVLSLGRSLAHEEGVKNKYVKTTPMPPGQQKLQNKKKTGRAVGYTRKKASKEGARKRRGHPTSKPSVRLPFFFFLLYLSSSFL